MNFNEYKNAEHWQKLRNDRSGQITLQQLVGILFAGAMFFVFAYLFAIAEA